MNDTEVRFYGFGKIKDFDKTKQYVFRMLEGTIDKLNIEKFYVGNDHPFCKLCVDVLDELKEMFPDKNISLVDKPIQRSEKERSNSNKTLDLALVYFDGNEEIYETKIKYLIRDLYAANCTPSFVS